MADHETTGSEGDNHISRREFIKEAGTFGAAGILTVMGINLAGCNSNNQTEPVNNLPETAPIDENPATEPEEKSTEETTTNAETNVGGEPFLNKVYKGEPKDIIEEFRTDVGTYFHETLGEGNFKRQESPSDGSYSITIIVPGLNRHYTVDFEKGTVSRSENPNNIK